MKKGLCLLIVSLMLVGLGALAFADGGEWVSSEMNGYISFASYVGDYDGWVDITGYGGVTLTESTDVRIISQNASVWAQPRTNSDKLGSVKNGEELRGRVDGDTNIIMQDGFYAVDYNGRNAWVNSAYSVCGPFEIVLMESNVPAYCTPNRNSKRVGSLNKLTRYTVLGFYDDFYVVNLREASAFIPMSVRHYDTTFMRYYHAAWSGEARTIRGTTVRSGPGDNYASVRDMDADTSFAYWDIIDGWCLLVDEKTGCYVYVDAEDTTAAQ